MIIQRDRHIIGGVRVNPWGDPYVEVRRLTLPAIYHALLSQPRYYGHRGAQCNILVHTLDLVAALESEGIEAQRWAFLHDIEEIIFGDIPSCVKPVLMRESESLRLAVRGWEECIFWGHNTLIEPPSPLCKALDKSMVLVDFEDVSIGGTTEHEYPDLDMHHLALIREKSHILSSLPDLSYEAFESTYKYLFSSKGIWL